MVQIKERKFNREERTIGEGGQRKKTRREDKHDILDAL